MARLTKSIKTERIKELAQQNGLGVEHDTRCNRITLWRPEIGRGNGWVHTFSCLSMHSCMLDFIRLVVSERIKEAHQEQIQREITEATASINF